MLEGDVDPAVLVDVVSDLGTYPAWLDIVGAAGPVATADEAAWWVELRAQLGPVRRSKRLRMVRTERTDRSVRFERRELDGRDHSPWTLAASVTVGERGTRLEMRLHYGGSLWLPILDRIVRDEIERSRPRLVAVVESVGGGRPAST